MLQHTAPPDPIPGIASPSLPQFAHVPASFGRDIAIAPLRATGTGLPGLVDIPAPFGTGVSRRLPL